jgi:hypothetical protein
MGYFIETSCNPAFSIGERVLVSGIDAVPKQWEIPENGTVISLALEIEQDEPIPSSEAEWHYHILLDSDTHVYSLESQIQRKG